MATFTVDVVGLQALKASHEDAAAAFRRGLEKFIMLDSARSNLVLAGLDGAEVALQVAELAKAQKVLCDQLDQDAVAALEAYLGRVHDVRETLRNITFSVLHLMPDEKPAATDYGGSGLFADALDPVGVTCASVEHCASLDEQPPQEQLMAREVFTPFEQVPEFLKAQFRPDVEIPPPPFLAPANSSDA